MRVLCVCTELHPLLQTGGLAAVGAALPAALRAQGCDVRRLLPAFEAIAAGVQIDGPALPLGGPGGPAVLRSTQPTPRILCGRLLATQEPLYLLDAPALYQRPGGPYLDPSGREWPDNAQRFALLSWAACRLGLGADPRWQPDVVHAHDWHTGLVPVYLQLAHASAPPASVFTIHNLAYQGLFPGSELASLGLPASLMHIDGVEFHGQISFMKAALQYADAITTVSPRYAREITTPEQGCGLDGLLRQRQAHLSGLLNGVDYSVWNPADDALTGAPFERANMAGKARIKSALQRAHGFQPRAAALLFGMVGRITEQKGLHLLIAVLDEIVARGGQLIVQGLGDAALEQSLGEAVARHPGAATLLLRFDETSAHRIIAGADVLLMPSRYEPCGLTQLYALRYGTLPLVHAVGGLADTVTDCSLEHLDDGSASGFTFESFDPESLRRAVRRAFALQRRPRAWAAVQDHAMQLRFDWHDTAHAYCQLFAQLRPIASAPAKPHKSDHEQRP